jgi:hypothetical protein
LISVINDRPLLVEEAKDARRSRLRQRQFRARSLMLVITLAAVWLGILLDPNVGPLLLLLSGAFGITLVVMGLAMGLGLLGFGLCSVCDRVLAWLRRASQWPDQ